MSLPKSYKLKIYLVLVRAMLSKSLEDRRWDELFLQQIVRETTSLKMFDLAAFTMVRFGSIFSLPTLMAYRDTADPNKRKAVSEALIELLMRTKPAESHQAASLFNPEYWRIKWIATPQKFVTFIACIGQLYDRERFLEPAFMDEIASRLLEEMDISLAPHQTFSELQLLTSPEEMEKDMYAINAVITQDMLVRSVTNTGDIHISEEQQIAENRIFMRCDYLVNKLQLPGDFEQNLYMLKALFTLNTIEKEL